MRSQLRFVLPGISIALAILLVVVIMLGGGSDGSSNHSSTQSGGFDGAALPPGVHAPGFTLEGQRGRRISLGRLRDQVVALVFVSTDCRACVLAAQQVRGALDELTDKPTYGLGTAMPTIQVLFVSTDPSADTRTSVKRFLAAASLASRAEYLTGTLAELRSVWRAYRIAPASAGRSASEAATTVLLIDRNGVERVGFGLEQMTPESISHDIRRLQAG